METKKVKDIAELNSILEGIEYWANGKNFKVDHLHDTKASSRWELENIFGIYLTKPEYAWMALWMAVTSRKNLKKRHLRYFVPKTSQGDFIGKIEIFSEGDNVADFFCEKAYLYLFDKKKYEDIPTKNYSQNNKKEKCIVSIDDWQICLVNFNEVKPNLEIEIGPEIIKELMKRVSITKNEIGRNYLINIYP